MISFRHLIGIVALLLVLSSVVACINREERECTLSNGCTGTQKCSDSFWGDCEKLEQFCGPYKYTECIMEINGVECNELPGRKRCDKCGTEFGECELVSKKMVCCPGQTQACDGSGEQECDSEGEWGDCFEGDSCNGIVCEGASMCNLHLCSMGECVFVVQENCCTQDTNCLTNKQCIENECIEVECGECFEAKNHGCAPKDRGVCCNGHWNEKYDSCEIDYLREQREVERVDDDLAEYLMGKGLLAMEDGFLLKADLYFESAGISADFYPKRYDYNEDVLGLIDTIFLEFEQASESENKSAFSKTERTLRNLLKLVQPDPTPGPDATIHTPIPLKQEETPWLLIGGLTVVLIVLVILFAIEFSKRKKTFFDTGKAKQKEK